MRETSIRRFLENHPRIACFIYVVTRKLKNADECRKLLNIDKNPFVVEYHVYGDKNLNKTIYNIFLGESYRAMGLCSLIRTTLLHLGYADYMGFEPTVCWKKTRYSIGDENTYEYLFKSVGSKYQNELHESRLVVNSKTSDRFFLNQNPYMTYMPNTDELDMLCKMAKKYFDLSDLIKEEICSQAKDMIGNSNVLGVHIRGTDFNENFSRHPVTVPLSEYLEKIEMIMAKHNYEFIFLATDEEKYVEELKKRFEDKLIYYKNCARSVDGKPLHYGTHKEMRKDGYGLAIDMLRDLFTLAMCDGLVGGLSNVTIMVQVINASFYDEFKDIVILNRGINDNLKQSIRHINRK